MSTQIDFEALQARHQRLLREHAVLEAREAEKAKRREELRILLLAAGVNADDPEAEAERLEAEIKRIFEKNEAELDAFEAELKAATLGQPLLTEDATKPSATRGPQEVSEPGSPRAPQLESEPSLESEPYLGSVTELDHVFPSDLDEPLHDHAHPEVRDDTPPHLQSEPEVRSEPSPPSAPKVESAILSSDIDLC